MIFAYVAIALVMLSLRDMYKDAQAIREQNRKPDPKHALLYLLYKLDVRSAEAPLLEMHRRRVDRLRRHLSP